MMNCGNGSRSNSMWRWCLAAVAFAVAACGGEERQPPDAMPIETPVQTVVRVSLDGNDAGDGFTQPVATLARAIALANQHHDITEIELASGRYESPDDA